MRKIILFFAVLAVMSMTATAGITWQRGDLGTTWQEWYFRTPANPTPPDVTNNPNATAAITVAGVTHGLNPGWYPQLWGRPGVWVGNDTTVTLTIPNVPIQNPYKEIWLEMVFWGELLPDTGIIFPQQGVTMIDEKLGYTADMWRIWNVGWRIEPNPEKEIIFIHILNSGAIVDYIIVDTICVPEPATLTILGLGGMMLLRRRA